MPRIGKVFRDEIVEIKRQRILEVARRLFYERGYEATTLDAIADQMEVSKPFLYSYYKNKSEILAEICSSGIHKSIAALDSALAAAGGPTDRLILFVREFTRVVCEEQVNVTIYLQEQKSLPRGTARSINTLRGDFDRRLAGLLREGEAAGELAPDDVDLCALLLGGMIISATFWYRPKGRLSLPELQEAIARQVLRLVGARSLSDSSPAR